MIHVVITQHDVEDVGRLNPSIPVEYWPGLALAKNGIRFRPTFGPLKERDMIPPWRVWLDKSSGTLHVQQGAKQ